jgi:hypothetical protein
MVRPVCEVCFRVGRQRGTDREVSQPTRPLAPAMAAQGQLRAYRARELPVGRAPP